MRTIWNLSGSDPGASFQADRILLTADSVRVYAVGPVIALAEVNQPGGLTLPRAQAFAVHLKVVPHVGMEDERQPGETTAGNVVGKIGQPGTLAAVLFHLEKARMRLGDGNDIVKLAGFHGQRNPQRVKPFMAQVFDGGECGRHRPPAAALARQPCQLPSPPGNSRLERPSAWNHRFPAAPSFAWEVPAPSRKMTNRQPESLPTSTRRSQCCGWDWKPVVPACQSGHAPERPWHWRELAAEKSSTPELPLVSGPNLPGFRQAPAAPGWRRHCLFQGGVGPAPAPFRTPADGRRSRLKDYAPASPGAAATAFSSAVLAAP